MLEPRTDSPLSSAVLSDLIGLIYETASDTSLWPRLLEGMEQTLTETFTTEFSEPGLASFLVPHFARAFQIQQQMGRLEAERDALERVMDRLPLGMAIVDASATTISMNRALLALVRGGEAVSLRDGRLGSLPAEALTEALRRAALVGAADQVLRLEGDAPVSLWISRLVGGSQLEAPRFLVLAAGQGSRALSETGLCELYGLTLAEARLTQHLALGRTVEEASRGLNISQNTAKTHLKRVFTKVGVRRQAELLQAVFASPLWLENAPPASAARRDVALHPVGGEGLRLADGRWLAYSDNGDPEGLPLIFMHGLGGSRHLRHPDDTLLLRHGIRLIIPERPGCGDSDPETEDGDWPADVAALADHLGIGRFALLGYSAGTIATFDTARALGERAAHLTLVAAVPPIQRLDDLRDYSATMRMSLLVAKYAPSLLPSVLRMVVRSIRENVHAYVEQSLIGTSESDRRVFEHPRLRATYAHGLLASTHKGEHGLAREIRSFVRAWGYDLAEITQPTRFWHGEVDHLVVSAGARKLWQRLPRARFETVPSAGHYVLFSHWEEILLGVCAQDRETRCLP